MINKINISDFLKEGFQTALEPVEKIESRAKEVFSRFTNGGAYGQEEIKKQLDSTVQRFKDVRTDVEKTFAGGLNKTLGILNLATHEEIQTLEKKVAKLTREVNALKPKTAKQTTKKKTATKK